MIMQKKYESILASTFLSLLATKQIMKSSQENYLQVFMGKVEINLFFLIFHEYIKVFGALTILTIYTNFLK